LKDETSSLDSGASTSRSHTPSETTTNKKVGKKRRKKAKNTNAPTKSIYKFSSFIKEGNLILHIQQIYLNSLYIHTQIMGNRCSVHNSTTF
jgi:hypothetical protein